MFVCHLFFLLWGWWGADPLVMSGSAHVPGVVLAEKLYSVWMVCGEVHCLSTKVGSEGGRGRRGESEGKVRGGNYSYF